MRVTRRVVWKASGAVCLAAAAGIIAAVSGPLLLRRGHGDGGRRGPHAATAAAGLTVERVRALSELTTLKVEVADAVVTELRGYTGGDKAVLVVKGDFVLAADLSAARFEAVD